MMEIANWCLAVGFILFIVAMLTEIIMTLEEKA